MINLELAEKKGLSSESILEIDRLHDRRELYVAILSDLVLEEEELSWYGKMLEHIEMRLQELWGFSIDASYTKFWRLPKCECPKMDNEDFMLPGPIYSGNCLLHKHHIGEAYAKKQTN